MILYWHDLVREALPNGRFAMRDPLPVTKVILRWWKNARFELGANVLRVYEGGRVIFLPLQNGRIHPTRVLLCLFILFFDGHLSHPITFDGEGYKFLYHAGVDLDETTARKGTEVPVGG